MNSSIKIVKISAPESLRTSKNFGNKQRDANASLTSVEKLNQFPKDKFVTASRGSIENVDVTLGRTSGVASVTR